MKNLMTHKFAFGVLMALVLAFSVQGVVEAQTTRVSADSAITSSTAGTTTIPVFDISGTNLLTRSFTLTVTGAADGETVGITATGATVTEIRTTSAPGDPASDPDDGTDPEPSPALNDVVSGTTITFGGLGNRNDGQDTTTGDPNTANWTFRVTYTVAALGAYSIEVDNNDLSPDIAAYVVQSKGKAASYQLNKAAAADITQTPQIANTAMEVQVTDGTTGQTWVQVDLNITNGRLYPTGQFVIGSRLYNANEANNNGYTALSVFTSTGGDIDGVTVAPNRGQTATVTAKISGVTGDHASHTVTYFDSGVVTIDRVSGNYQHAKEGDRLAQPLVVRVLDGTRNVANQRVRFTASGGQLRSVTGSTFINETGSAEGTTAISIKTDGSGQAKVYLTAPTTAAAVTVNAEVAQTPPAVAGTADGTGSPLAQLSEQFTVFAVERNSATLSNLIINVAPPTPVENADPDRNDIYVTVTESDGTTAITAPVEVNFTVTGGQLYLNPSLLDLDANSLRQSTDRPRYVTQLNLSTNASGQIGTSGAPILFVKVNSGIAVVRAEVVRSSQDAAVRTIQYIAGSIRLETVSNNPRIRGALGGLRSDPFVVRATIGGSPAPGQIVKFTHTQVSNSALVPVPGTKVFLTSQNSFIVDPGANPTDLIPAATSVPVEIRREETYTVANGSPIFVETDSDGEAQVYLQMGTADGVHTITATLPVGSETESFTVEPQGGTIAGELKKIDVPDLRPNDDNIDTLAIRAVNLYGDRLPAVNIRFTTTYGTIIYVSSHGTLTDNDNTVPAPAETANTGQEIFVQTDAYGEVWVLYRKNQNISSGQTVRAEIASEQGSQQYDFEIRHQTFNIGQGTGDPTPPTSRPSLSLSTSTLRGSPGQQQSFIVYARNASGALQQNVLINLSSGINISGLPSSVISGQSVSITLPNSNTFITASTGTHGSQRLTVTVQAVPAAIVKVSGDSPAQTGEPSAALSSAFVVRVDDRNNNPVSGQTVTFRVTGGGGNFSGSTSTTATTDSSGQARATLTLGSAAGTNTVEASVGTLSAVTFTATARARITRLQIDNGNNQIGEVNRALDQDLSVRLVDQDLTGIPRQLVTFRTVEGSGRFSPSDNVRTDSRGYATVTFTPSSAGSIEIEAASGTLSPVTFTITTGEPPDALVYISGNNQTGSPGARLANPFVVEVIDENDDPVEGAAVTFAVTAGGGSLSVTSVTTNGTGRAQTYLRLGEETGDNTVVARVLGLTDRITFKATSGAEVLVGAAQRPPMYWISRADGKLHRLVDAEVENLAPNIDNILSLTVDTQNQLLYWTRQTAESRSAIQRAGLNGKGVITLQTSLTLMTSIAVNNTGTTLYWADILGKIKSRPVQGNRVTLLAQNLSSPTGLVWSNEYLYWGEATGQIRRMNLRNNRRTIETITTSSGEPVSLAVQSGRVYWTEISGNAAQLNRVNTNGTGVEALKTLVGSRRVWIDVDGSDSKIYLTRASKLERRGLSGRSTVNLVTGLASPGSLVLGGELVATPPVVSQPTQPAQPAQPTVASKYDINQDGSVNNADTRAVAGAVGQSGAAITNPRTDVDGSGTVDVTDLILVIANLDADVAAPTIDIDLKALDLDFDRVQEQVEVLLASGDRSIAAQRALLYLQHLLASARPDETVLLANYPNPFNPETWIPYHLAESTEVRVNIYDAQGVLVRVLPLGHQPAGYYTSRNRAAYWDGKNALGERVASGIYFYQLQTDETSPMRKMVILK